MRTCAGRFIGTIGLAVMIAGCTNPPEVPVRQHYLQQRLRVTDPTQPCIVEPYPPMQAELVHDTIFVPVRINGIDTIGKFDTGASNSLITPELAAAARLTVQPGPTRLIGISGSFHPDVARVDAVEIGSIRRTNVGTVMVYPFGSSNRNKQIGALVGLDWLDQFDYDIDLANHRIRPFRTSNCVIVDPPWRTSYTGLAMTRGVSEGLNTSAQEIFTTFGLTAHLSIPVDFEGGMVNAMLDTGSPQSIMSHQGAIAAGATSAQLQADPEESIAGLNGRQRQMVRHRFGDVAIGEEEMRGFSVLVGTHYNRTDDAMILGADYLAKRHLWLSLTTNALFIDSGEPRKPTPPFDHPHAIGGSQMPAFPPEAKEHSGTVDLACKVEADGSLSGCRITKAASDAAFNKAAISWLTGGAGPVMQPGYRNGHPEAEDHTWEINFAR